MISIEVDIFYIVLSLLIRHIYDVHMAQSLPQKAMKIGGQYNRIRTRSIRTDQLL